MIRDSKPLKYWIFSFLWVVFIYSTLSIVKPIVNFLKKEIPFNEAVSISLVVIFIFTVMISARRIKIMKISTWILLAGMCLLYIVSFKWITYPEEKIHLIEYGLLTFFIYKALSFRVGGILPYLIAFLLTSLAGWGDEAIQSFIPNRYYQVSDIILNAVSSAMALIVIYIFKREDYKIDNK